MPLLMPAPVEMHPARSRKGGFTLVELLAVLAIIGILAAIILATVGKVRANAQTTKCGANIRQIQSLALVWSQDNKDWCPQAMWSAKNINSMRLGATNLRAVGFTDEVGKCGAVETPSPNYGINSNLVTGTPQWGDNYAYYYEHGRYKMRAILSSRTIMFVETDYVAGWSLNGSGAYLGATTTLGPHHNDQVHVAYADGHVGLCTPAALAVASVWTDGIR